MQLLSTLQQFQILTSQMTPTDGALGQ